MARKYKLNKVELTRMRREMKTYQQFLPVLKLKQEQLQAEQLKIRRELDARRAEVAAGWGDKYTERVHKKGKLTARERVELLKDAGTILWNGPVGVFEIDQFGKGTEVLSKAIAASPGFSIAGGGDTYSCVLLQGSGTFGLEASSATFIPPGGHVLVLANGA